MDKTNFGQGNINQEYGQGLSLLGAVAKILAG